MDADHRDCRSRSDERVRRHRHEAHPPGTTNEARALHRNARDAMRS